MLLHKDCDIFSQIDEELCSTCPRTCSNFYLICINDNLPDCSCPLVQVFNKLNNACDPLRDCHSKRRV